MGYIEWYEQIFVAFPTILLIIHVPLRTINNYG